MPKCPDTLDIEDYIESQGGQRGKQMRNFTFGVWEPHYVGGLIYFSDVLTKKFVSESSAKEWAEITLGEYKKGKRDHYYVLQK